MPTRDVSDVLSSHGLSSPDLEMLRPTESRYTAVLMQPSGPIFANAHRIGPFDVGTASAKGTTFLELARTRGAHLAVTPEYFFPWVALEKAITAGLTPAADALWVLGCESATEESLEQFKESVKDHCLVIHESVQALPLDRHLLDPVVLLFQAIRPDGTTQLVALVQFKTFPSRDDLFLEEAVLRRGSIIYRFRGRSGHLTAAVIICSDAFALSPPWLNDFNHQATLIHIQLNPNPRNATYRQYRTITFSTDPKATNCHIVCLNWAQAIVQYGDPGTEVEEWKNIAGSAWYCPLDECSSDDAVVLPNHNFGVYYTYMKERRHALHFHYDESVYELLASKLLRLVPAVMANRNGPSAVQRYEWSGAAMNWIHGVSPVDAGFDTLVTANPQAHAALQNVLPAATALSVERILALSAGAISGRTNWYIAQNIDSCQIAEDEVVHRMTVVQDVVPYAFRHDRLNSVAQIHHELMVNTQWPAQVKGVDLNSTIFWDGGSPQFNVKAADELPALIVYLGESPAAKDLENKADMLYEFLRHEGGVHQKRLCIMYRLFGQLKFAPIAAMTRFDDATEDQTDFMAVQPLDDFGAKHG